MQIYLKFYATHKDSLTFLSLDFLQFFTKWGWVKCWWVSREADRERSGGDIKRTQNNYTPEESWKKVWIYFSLLFSFVVLIFIVDHDCSVFWYEFWLWLTWLWCQEMCILVRLLPGLESGFWVSIFICQNWILFRLHFHSAFLHEPYQNLI